MYELATHAGIGGFQLATQQLLGWQTVCYIERDRFCVDVLAQRIADGMLNDAPVWSDIRSFTKRNGQAHRFIRQLRRIRRQLVITGGFPCQPFSAAGKMQAGGDSRNTWPALLRCIREIRPAWVFLENVPSLATGKHRYFGRILSGLAQSGYDARWRVLSAAELGAPHQRKRLWIVAHAVSQRRGPGRVRNTKYDRHEPRTTDSYLELLASQLANPACRRLTHGYDLSISQGALQQWRLDPRRAAQNVWHERGAIQPAIPRDAHGVADWVDRTKATGNALVPAVAAAAWHLLTQEMLDAH